MSCEARQPPLRPKRSLIKGKQAKSAKSLKRKGPDPVLDACFSASGLCAHYHHGASACMLVSAPRVLAMPQERKQDKAEQACTQEHSWLFLLEPPQPLWKECLRMVWWPVKDIYTEYRQRAPCTFMTGTRDLLLVSGKFTPHERHCTFKSPCAVVSSLETAFLSHTKPICVG